ncbi:MAG: TAT-variant-translocated molybdopterin oxidoreductase [Ignavibacteria bacterium]|nr:TAT-variant-translocated molybdopterin oxidoreductase [Ignavibacteria bacterium]
MDNKEIKTKENIIQSTSVDFKDNSPEAEKDINYWQSFRDLYNDPDFINEKRKEFAPGALDRPDENSISKLSRRKFLALLSASAAVAASGCSNFREKGEFIPYNKKPEEVTLGNPTYYASTCTGCSSACGILIKTMEGRPIKVDGNPDHPVSKGKVCAIAQASVMSLYDPERLKNPVERVNKTSPKEVSWAEIDDKIIGEIKKAASGNKEIAIVTHTINSPSRKKLLDEFKTTYPSAKVYSYELFNESARNSAWEKCYGSKVYPLIKWNDAKVILSLESDFLGTEGNKVETSRLYTENRDAFNGKEFNRLYAVEGNTTVTGMNADYRMILRTDAIEEFVMCLLNEFVSKQRVSAFASDSGISSKLSGNNLGAFAEKNNLSKQVIDHLVSDLKKNMGSSYISAGSMLPESTHIAVNLLNEVLGNTKLYVTNVSNVELIPLSTKAELESLVSGIRSGNTSVVIHFDSNPVYHLPTDSGYAEAIKNVPLVITITESENESAEVSNYVLPVNSMFESWGDFQTRNNFASLQQPVIAPLYNTRQKEEILLTWIKGTKDAFNNDIYHQYVMDNWKGTVLSKFTSEADFKKAWYGGLNDGVVSVSPVSAAGETSAVTFKPESFTTNNSKLTQSSDYVVILTKSSSLGDGRYANNGWLQELPKSVSRVAWDNFAAISVQTSKALDLKQDDIIKITTSGGSLDIPVFVQPGIAEGVVAVELGYGRSVCGIVGKDVGFNGNKLMTQNPALSSWMYNDAKISKTGDAYEIVTTQDHYAFDEPLYKDIQYRREIIQEGTYLGWKENSNFLEDRHTKYSEEEKAKLKVGSINKQYEHTGLKWGMVIDLNKCIGCNECVAACSVENNIPVVGKEQTKNHRAMQWMRIDRYYSGTPEAPKASFQPMLCQHCDFAPCENVCPVAATTHSADGINGMAYNRCVGTRYCSNNCPYKVRRFNYFNFRDHFREGIQQEESFSLMANPEVTVRSRGVMEKCTFCLQRIMDERQMAIQENRLPKGSNVKTACQEACNTNAISFGDQNDKSDNFYKLNNSSLGYSVLEEIKVKPNITYLAKLRNVYEMEKEEGHH